MISYSSALVRGMVASLLLLCSTLALASPEMVGGHLESSLDARFGQKPLSVPQQYEMTRQGLAEAIELHGTLLRTGVLSPRGWVLDCGGIRRQARAWLGRTDTLTGVFLGASLLEHWSVSCRNRMKTIWVPADLRRIERATLRAVKALPPSWPPVSMVYTPAHVRDHLNRVNQGWGVLVEDRECFRQALRDSRKNKWSLPRTVFESTACQEPPAHGVLLDPDILERLEGIPMTTTLATSFLGLDRWVLNPATMAQVLSTPEAMEKMVMEMTFLTPAPLVLQEREGWFAHVQLSPQSQAESVREVRALASRLVPVLSQWPTPQECRKAGDQVRQSLSHASHFPVVLSSLLSWPRLQIVCPQEELGLLESGTIDGALVRVARALPEDDASRALAAPLAKTYQAELAAQTPPSRMRCIKEILGDVRQESDILAMGLRRARAYCPVAYQEWLGTGDEP